MTHKALHATAELAVSGTPKPREWLRDPSITYLRLRGLASMAMALDPTLGPGLRFIQRGPVNPEERRALPFDLVFTNDTRRKLPYGVIEDESPVPFWEGIARVMGPEAAAAERERIEMMPRQRFATPEAAALYSAYRDAQIQLHRRPVNDETLVVTSDAIMPRADEFMYHADLARTVYLTPVPEVNPSGPRDAGRDAVRHTRQLVQRIRSVLDQPFESVSTADRVGVVRAIATLDGPRAAVGSEPTFEERQAHGWAGYALAQKQGGWVPFLLAKKAVSPHVPYGTARPLEIAIAQNDAGAVAALLKAGVSANVAMRGWPELYDSSSQKLLSNEEDMFVAPLAFASAVGATAAAGALLRAGAHPDFGTEHGRTPLAHAAAAGDDAMARLLLAHGANPAHPDENGVLPAEKVPNIPELNSLFELLESPTLKLRQEGGSPEPAAATAEVGATEVGAAPPEHPIPSMWEEPTRRRGMRMR